LVEYSKHENYVLGKLEALKGKIISIDFTRDAVKKYPMAGGRYIDYKVRRYWADPEKYAYDVEFEWIVLRGKVGKSQRVKTLKPENDMRITYTYSGLDLNGIKKIEEYAPPKKSAKQQYTAPNVAKYLIWKLGKEVSKQLSKHISPKTA